MCTRVLHVSTDFQFWAIFVTNCLYKKALGNSLYFEKVTISVFLRYGSEG